jgi:hypothetical protein
LVGFGERIQHVNAPLAVLVLGYQFQQKMPRFMGESLMSGAHQMKALSSY